MAFLLVFLNEGGPWNIYAWCDDIWRNNSTNTETDYSKCHITHIINIGKECYCKACLTVDNDDKKVYIWGNGNILGTNDGLERQIGSPHDMS
jgi:hypothetical protein